MNPRGEQVLEKEINFEGIIPPAYMISPKRGYLLNLLS